MQLLMFGATEPEIPKMTTIASGDGREEACRKASEVGWCHLCSTLRYISFFVQYINTSALVLTRVRSNIEMLAEGGNKQPQPRSQTQRKHKDESIRHADLDSRNAFAVALSQSYLLSHLST